MPDDEKREVPFGGRREYDPPAITLREHVETLLSGMQVRIELELATLSEKITNLHKASSREHAAVIQRLYKLEEKVESLEDSELRRQGGKVVLGRGAAVLLGVGTLLGVAASVVMAVIAL